MFSSPDANEETPERRNGMFYWDIPGLVYLEFTSPFRPFRDRLQHFILKGANNNGCHSHNQSKPQECTYLITPCLLVFSIHANAPTYGVALPGHLCRTMSKSKWAIGTRLKRKKKQRDIPGVQSTFPNGIPVGEPRQESLECVWERRAKGKE
jgi:hypothetical protein